MALKKRPGALWADHTGASAVEFALLMPIYLLLVLGILAYGIYFGAAHAVQQLTADAARAAVAGLDPAERGQIVTSYLARNGGAYVLLDPERLSVTSGASGADPNQYVVEVRYDARDLPIWNLNVPLPSPGRVIAYRSTIRNGGV